MQQRVHRLWSRKALLAAMTTALFAAGGLHLAAEQNDNDRPAALHADQVILCLRTAVAAKPGRVVSIENETEKGRLICEVKVRADNGMTYEVEVDVALNKVLKIERDVEDSNETIRT